MPDVSVIIPLFNEAPCVGPLVASLDLFLADFQRTCEIILVDDGSSDETGPAIVQLLGGRPEFQLISMRTNRGQTSAMAAGLSHARGEYIVFMDGDLQNDPQDIPRLLDRLEDGFDLVSGWRRDRKDRTVTRKIPSRVANWIIGHVTGVRVHDYGCSLKAYRSSILQHMNLYSDMHRFLPALCWREGARVTEIVVQHHARAAGSSKYGLNRIFKVMADLMVIKLIVSFSDRPMHYFGLLSLSFLGLSGLMAALWAYNLVQDWREGTIILPAIVVLSFCCFLYFLFIGLLADMIVRVGARDPAEVTTAGVMEIH